MLCYNLWKKIFILGESPQRWHYDGRKDKCVNSSEADTPSSLPPTLPEQERRSPLSILCACRKGHEPETGQWDVKQSLLRVGTPETESAGTDLPLFLLPWTSIWWLELWQPFYYYEEENGREVTSDIVELLNQCWQLSVSRLLVI